MTSKMIETMKTFGNEWHKNDMHRLYIDLVKANELYSAMDDMEHCKLPLNRNEKASGKVWIDLTAEEIKFSTKYIGDADGVVECIMELVSKLANN